MTIGRRGALKIVAGDIPVSYPLRKARKEGRMRSSGSSKLGSCAMIVIVGCVLFASDAAAQTLTWTVATESKLFINTISPAECYQSAVDVVGVPMTALDEWRFAAFRAFCQATSLGENPPTGALVTPLDARIRAGVNVTFSCEAGMTTPVAPVGLTVLPTGAGPELGLITGGVNDTTTREHLLAEGEYAYVASGYPNHDVEGAFQFFKLRTSPDIWHHFESTVTCGVDAMGLPMAVENITLTTTAFPSHKVWHVVPSAPPAGAEALDIAVAQGSFSALWWLPPIPSP